MKMIICRGLPGSGKSTLARELCAQGYKRFNKDDLRAMIDNGQWSSTNEEFVYLAQMALVEAALIHGEPIVVDNTHGSERQVRRLTHLAEMHDYTADIKVFDTPIEECIARDKARPSPVGEAVIRRIANEPFFKELYRVKLDNVSETVASGSSEYRGHVRGLRDDRGES